MADQQERLQTALADRYRLERELGRRGMATVYLAQDLRHGRSVAFKVLHPHLAATLGPERFLREIRLAGRQTLAIDRLEYLLSIPSMLSGPLLRADPGWASLRANPRFQKLVAGN